MFFVVFFLALTFLPAVLAQEKPDMEAIRQKIKEKCQVSIYQYTIDNYVLTFFDEHQANPEICEKIKKTIEKCKVATFSFTNLKK